MLSYHNENFIVDQKETFIWGGEFHYFRVRKCEWKDRLQKIKDMGFNLVSTYIPWIWHEKEEGQIDLEGKTSAERDLKAFLEAVKDIGLWLLVRPGPYVMAETVNSGIPEWLIEKHPDIRAQKEDGSYHQSTGLVSYMHKTYLRYVDYWYKAVFGLLSQYEYNQGGPIIMIQYDNEVGMFHWVTGQGDYSPVTLSYFKAYIVETYRKEIFTDVLNTYKDFDHYMSAYCKHETGQQASIEINQAYKTFFRTYIKTYLEKLIEIAKSYGAKSLPVVNVHGFSQIDYSKRGNRYPVGLSQLYETSKIKDVVIAGDYYVGNIVSENFFDVVIANAFTRAIQPKDQPLFSAEFQGGFQNGVPRLQPTTHDLKTRLTIATGMNAINYYMFVGGENYQEIGIISRRHDWQSAIGYDGSLRRHYHVIKHIVDVVSSYEKALLKAKLKTHTTLAFDADYYMTEYQNQYNRHIANHLTNARQNYLYNGIGKSLVMNNISFDSIDMIGCHHIDPKQHPTLITFSLEWMREDAQKTLKKYVEDGGKLFLFPEIPTKDLNDKPCTVLKDFINVEILDKTYGKRVNLNGHDSVNCHYAQVYDVKEGFASLDLDHQKITGFKKALHKGMIYVFGMAIKSDWDYIDQFTYEILKDMNISKIETSPEWLNVYIRSGMLGSFVFIHNFEEFDKQSQIVVDQEILFDGFEFSIPMRRGLILPMDWKVTKDFMIKYSTCEVTHVDLNSNEITISFKPNSDHDEVLFEGDYQIKNHEDINVKEHKIVFNHKQQKTITWTKASAK